MMGLTVTPAETSPSLAAIVATVDPEVVGVRDQTSPEGMVTIVGREGQVCACCRCEVGEVAPHQMQR